MSGVESPNGCRLATAPAIKDRIHLAARRAAFWIARMARSIFSTVETDGSTLPRSIRFRAAGPAFVRTLDALSRKKRDTATILFLDRPVRVILPARDDGRETSISRGPESTMFQEARF